MFYFQERDIKSSIMAKGCFVARVLLLRCFLLLLPNYIHVTVNGTTNSYNDKREVLQNEYSQPPILPSPHFRWVVNITMPFSTCANEGYIIIDAILFPQYGTI